MSFYFYLLFAQSNDDKLVSVSIYLHLYQSFLRENSEYKQRTDFI